jgi:YD repeat-containing protein
MPTAHKCAKSSIDPDCQLIDELGHVTQYDYDANGNQISNQRTRAERPPHLHHKGFVTSGTDALGRSITSV